MTRTYTMIGPDLERGPMTKLESRSREQLTYCLAVPLTSGSLLNYSLGDPQSDLYSSLSVCGFVKTSVKEKRFFQYFELPSPGTGLQQFSAAEQCIDLLIPNHQGLTYQYQRGGGLEKHQGLLDTSMLSCPTTPPFLIPYDSRRPSLDIPCNNSGRQLKAVAREASVETDDHPSTTAVVEALSNPTTEHGILRSFIIHAEDCSFDERQLQTIRPILKRFITQYRESSVQLDQVAVNSAIRKYVATMGIDEFTEAGFLLEPTSHACLPITIELEVTKMVVRKLTARPEFSAGSDLADRLWDIAQTYLSDRLLARERYGATALNSVIGLALLRSHHFDHCLPLLTALRSKWFLDHLAHRSLEILNELTRFASDVVAPHKRNLSRLLPNPLVRQ